MRILFNAVDSEATGAHRVLQPLKALNQSHPAVTGEPLKISCLEDQLSGCDGVFLQCLIGPQQFSLMEKLKQKGVPILLDYDDDFSNLPGSILSRLFLTERQATKNWKFYLDSATHITVPTEMLAGRVKELSKTPVTVVPNYISAAELSSTANYANPVEDEIRILYSCSESHIDDFIYISSVLGYVGQNFPKTKIISHGGLNFTYFQPHFKGRHEYYNKVSYASYYDALRTIKPHIFIAPLKATPHNVCRSNLKYLQAGLLKAAFLGENLPPYTRVREKKTGLLATTRVGWWWNLRKLVNEPKLIEYYGNLAHEDLKNFLLEDSIQEWADVFHTVFGVKNVRTDSISNTPC